MSQIFAENKLICAFCEISGKHRIMDVTKFPGQ